jgi:hypothetical protein
MRLSFFIKFVEVHREGLRKHKPLGIAIVNLESLSGSCGNDCAVRAGLWTLG